MAAPLTPFSRPLRWGPGPVPRTAALALITGVAAGISYTAHSFATDGFRWNLLIHLLALPIWINFTAVLLNWRVTADSSGLWLTGAWTVRHVPWEQLRAAEHTDQGRVEIRRTGGGTWQLTGLGEPRLERRLRLRPSYVRMAEEVTALHTHPELRPTEPSPPRDRGLPLGPVLLVLVCLAATAVLIG